MWIYQPIKKYKSSRNVLEKNNMKRKNCFNAYIVPRYMPKLTMFF